MLMEEAEFRLKYVILSDRKLLADFIAER